ncbi:MAG: hypothetical protein COA63_014095 [Methylophaga sp.]|nr:hypothetical protein [Methylophaga sp.]
MEDFLSKFLTPQNAVGTIAGSVLTYWLIAKGWLPTKKQAELEVLLATEISKRQELERRISSLEKDLEPFKAWADKLAEEAMNGKEI